MRELKKKEAKQVISEISRLLPTVTIDSKTLFEEEISKDLRAYMLRPGKDVVAIGYKNLIFPALNLLWKRRIRPPDRYLVVDQGAIKPVLRGARILRPGVLEAKGIEKHALCFVLEAVNRTPIALGYCLMDLQELQTAERGVVALNIHHLGDRIWRLDFS